MTDGSTSATEEMQMEKQLKIQNSRRNWHELFLRGQKETRGFLFWGLESPVYSILWLHYPRVRFFFFSSLLNLSPRIVSPLFISSFFLFFFSPLFSFILSFYLILLRIAHTRSPWRRHSARTTSRRIARAITYGLSLTRMSMMSPNSKTSTLVRPPRYTPKMWLQAECSVRWS